MTSQDGGLSHHNDFKNSSGALGGRVGAAANTLTGVTAPSRLRGRKEDNFVDGAILTN